MLKNKVIGTFVAVWFAVCLSYGGLRAAFATMLGASIAPAQAMTASWENEEETSQSVVVFDREALAEAAQDQDQAEKPAEAPEQAPAEAPEEAEAEEPEEEPAEAQTKAPVEEPEEEPAEEPTVEESYEEDGSSYEEESWEAEAEEVYVPSLEEYLSQYTCGSCRRNCSLANPHCFNGSQLADAKAQEYYSMF